MLTESHERVAPVANQVEGSSRLIARAAGCHHGRCPDHLNNTRHGGRRSICGLLRGASSAKNPRYSNSGITPGILAPNCEYRTGPILIAKPVTSGRVAPFSGPRSDGQRKLGSPMRVTSPAAIIHFCLPPLKVGRVPSRVRPVGGWWAFTLQAAAWNAYTRHSAWRKRLAVSSVDLALLSLRTGLPVPQQLKVREQKPVQSE